MQKCHLLFSILLRVGGTLTNETSSTKKESSSLYGWPISSCQDHSVYDQLVSGVRFIDLRFGFDPSTGRLAVYHGVWHQGATIESVFDECYRFLDEHPTETLIASIKQAR
jgi:1-phosphatidylinositol phosphodiesterase